MKRWRTATLALLAPVLLFAGSEPIEASACAWSSEPLFELLQQPEDEAAFAKGKLDLIRREFDPSYLVVAYRYLTEQPLSSAEQAGALDTWHAQRGEPSSMISLPSLGTLEAPWTSARRAVMGDAGPQISVGFQYDFAWIDNCHADAFTTAARALAERSQRYGAKDVRLQRWVSAQDLVFANCSRAASKIPDPLPATASLFDRADRAYQIAAAHFYAGNFTEAEKRFRTIAADANSVWRSTARLLVVRTLTRRATLEPTAPRSELLLRAEEELKRILKDPAAKTVHDALGRYRGYLRAKLDAAAYSNELGIRLARPLATDFAQSLYDYAFVPAAPVDTSDRLGTFVASLKVDDGSGYDTARELWNTSRHPAWLVAALMTAKDQTEAQLEPLLVAAKNVPENSAAYITARFHWARLRYAQTNTKGVYRELDDILKALGASAPRSTLHAYRDLAIRTAPTLQELVRHAASEHAGYDEEQSRRAVPQPVRGVYYIHPTAAELLRFALSTAELSEIADSPHWPAALAAHVAATAYVRALLLEQPKAQAKLARVVKRLNPALRTYVEQIERSRTESERKFAVIYLLLKAPLLSTEVSTEHTGPVTLSPMASRSDDYLWCARPDPKHIVLPRTTFKSSDATALAREQKRLLALGSGPSFLAREASALAKTHAADPRLPEMLHLAVQATRFGCGDSENTRRSREAFRTLHRLFPKSPWAKRTPYYY